MPILWIVVWWWKIINLEETAEHQHNDAKKANASNQSITAICVTEIKRQIGLQNGLIKEPPTLYACK